MNPLWLEFITLYGVIPVVFAVAAERLGYRGAMAPILWLVSLGVCVAMSRTPGFDSKQLWVFPLEHPYVRIMLVRFVLLGAGLLALGRYLAPQAFLWIPRKRPRLWAAFLVLYTLLSALPQGLIWRVFLVHRYGGLFGDETKLIVAGAAAFALAHLAFWYVTAILVTAVGGALFLSTYLTTHSMLLAAFEHGAYGFVAFTAGMGAFLYRGRRPGSDLVQA